MTALKLRKTPFQNVSMGIPPQSLNTVPQTNNPLSALPDQSQIALASPAMNAHLQWLRCPQQLHGQLGRVYFYS